MSCHPNICNHASVCLKVPPANQSSVYVYTDGYFNRLKVCVCPTIINYGFSQGRCPLLANRTT